MADRYGSVASVITRTGIDPEDLELDDAAALETFIEGVLDEVTDLMDRKMRKSYLAEASVPKGLDGIANDAASDSLRVMVQTRQTPVVRIDEFAVKTVASRMLSPDILKRLKSYAKGGGVGSYDLVQPDVAGLTRVFTIADLDAE